MSAGGLLNGVLLTTDSGTATGGTAGTNQQGPGVFETKTSTALFTIIVLIVIVLGVGGRIWGGYGNYPGYGGFSEYGYTIPKSSRRYRYDPYDIYDD